MFFMVLMTLTMLTTSNGPSEAVLHPANDTTDQRTVQSGRAWLVGKPGAGDGSVRQIDAVSPCIVGDGKENQGFGYLMGFVVDETFVKAAAQDGAKVTLTVRTGKAVNGGAHAPVKLILLDPQRDVRKWSAFGAYNKTSAPRTVEGELKPDADDTSVTFDLTKAITDAGGIEPGKAVYLVLLTDPLTNSDDKGQHLEIHSDGEHQPALKAAVPAPATQPGDPANP